MKTLNSDIVNCFPIRQNDKLIITYIHLIKAEKFLNK